MRSGTLYSSGLNGSGAASMSMGNATAGLSMGDADVDMSGDADMGEASFSMGDASAFGNSGFTGMMVGEANN